MSCFKLAREIGRNQPRGFRDEWSRPFARALATWGELTDLAFEVQHNLAAADVARAMTAWCHHLAPGRTARGNVARASALAGLITDLLTRALNEPPKLPRLQEDMRERVSGQLGWVPLPTRLTGILSNWHILAAPRPGTPVDALALTILAAVRDTLGPSGTGFFPRR